jgi:regulator of chromosome condensation
MKTLNAAFYEWFRGQVKSNSCADLVNGAQDYIDFSTQLEERYLRSYGEVLTFGSGDCGQLAHGIEDDCDLMVPYPRIVYSLR